MLEKEKLRSKLTEENRVAYSKIYEYIFRTFEGVSFNIVKDERLLSVLLFNVPLNVENMYVKVTVYIFYTYIDVSFEYFKKDSDERVARCSALFSDEVGEDRHILSKDLFTIRDWLMVKNITDLYINWDGGKTIN